MNVPTSSYQLLPQTEKIEAPTTITLPTYLLTSPELREICRRLRVDQSGSRIACLIRIDAKMVELREIEQMTQKYNQCYCDTCYHLRYLTECSYLASMPMEIKEIIAYWVYHLPPNQTQDTFDESDSDDEGLPLDDIRSLASVNRSFYQVCRPYLFERLNFLGVVLRDVEFAQREIVPRHFHYVKKIWWRISFTELSVHEELCESMKDESWQSLWDPEDRSELLLKILLACPRITDLDIDIDIPMDSTTDIKRSSRRRSNGRDMLHKFMTPVSQLTSLTHLSLTVPCRQKAFSEDSLVRIIVNLYQLQSFTCTNIDAAHRYVIYGSEPPPSPLGAQLAGLSHLTRLVLKDARCFNDSWAQLNWRSPLKELALINCSKITVSLFHAFTKLFASTLVELETYKVPSEPTWAAHPELQEALGGLSQFELPRLISLKTSQHLSINFIRAFYTSRNLTKLSLDKVTYVKYDDLVKLIEDQIWSNLQEFEITHRTTSKYLPLDQIKELKLICQRNGIQMNDTHCYEEYEHPEPREEDSMDESEEEEYGGLYWEM